MTQTKTLDDYLRELPDSWDKLSLGDFMKTIDVPISEGGENPELSGMINVTRLLAALYEKPVEFFENMNIAILTKFANRLAFTRELPKPGKSDKKDWWKDPDTVSYSEFVAFLTLAKDPVHNIPAIIQAFSATPKTEAEVLAMSMAEAYGYFFTLSSFASKYLRRLARRTSRQLVKQTAQSLIHYKRNKRQTD